MKAIHLSREPQRNGFLYVLLFSIGRQRKRESPQTSLSHCFMKNGFTLVFGEG
jgi:hypothetical protein